MEAAEVRAAREWLGLTQPALAQHMGVSTRAVRGWEVGAYSPTQTVCSELERLVRYTRDEIQRYTQWARQAGAGAVLIVAASDAAMSPTPPAPLGAAWWRMVAQQVHLAVPEVTISYQPPADQRPATTWTPPPK